MLRYGWSLCEQGQPNVVNLRSAGSRQSTYERPAYSHTIQSCLDALKGMLCE